MKKKKEPAKWRKEAKEGNSSGGEFYSRKTERVGKGQRGKVVVRGGGPSKCGGEMPGGTTGDSHREHRKEMGGTVFANQWKAGKTVLLYEKKKKRGEVGRGKTKYSREGDKAKTEKRRKKKKKKKKKKKSFKNTIKK